MNAKAVLVFDADNTLWDTDSVFRYAQLAMLEKFALANLLKNPYSHLGTLRELDREFFHQIGKFEYDFRLLCAALYYLYSLNISIPSAVNTALQAFESNEMSKGVRELIDTAFAAFHNNIATIPELFVDAVEILEYIRSLSGALKTVLFSEGKSDRLKKFLIFIKLGANL